jgi:hypothetical protein
MIKQDNSKTSYKSIGSEKVKPGHECATGNSPAAPLVPHRASSFSSTGLQLSSSTQHQIMSEFLFKSCLPKHWKSKGFLSS